MALEFKEEREKLENGELNENELKLIDEMEVYIDSLIKKNFNGSSVSIPTNVVAFKFNPNNPKELPWSVSSEIKDVRKSVMSKELKRRYERTGWAWNFEEGEDDGPNRPAISYWILKGA